MRTRTYIPRWWAVSLLVALLTIVVGGALAAYLIESLGVPPRALAPYIERRVSQHNPIIVKTGEWMARSLTSLDRASQQTYSQPHLRIGAQATISSESTAGTQTGNIVLVDSTDKAVKAITEARPGDVITFSAGTYRFRGRYIEVNRAGIEGGRITVRAERPGSVVVELETEEGFLVSAPYWTFENLTIRGVCREHSNCEHAFHVVADARHFVARNNTIMDFNSHFKINGIGKKMPDGGLIEGNTLTNTGVRNTGNPVTVIDLVAASRWDIRRNLITDFIKGQSNQISFGAFAKGAGTDNRFQQNIVICEHLLKGEAGQRVGLSLGGGGTGKQYCRDRRCTTEQDRGIIESNLIGSCSDDGIYINRSAGSKVFHNTVIDTGGISVRFAESSADVEGNVVDGSIRSRDDSIVRNTDNLETRTMSLYLGMHPVRDLYMPDLMWSSDPPRRSPITRSPIDLCGEKRPLRPTYGAFERFSACFSQNPVKG